jgi:hypothetical protein
MEKLLKVEGYDDLLKDPTTGVIINANTKAYEQYLAKRRQTQTVQKQLEINASEIQSLKQDMSEIKNLLTQILNK